MDRRLGNDIWNRRCARLPDRGVLLYATDLQGSFKDYLRMKELYALEEAAGNAPILAFCGDLVHGPSPDMNEPGAWPDYLGTPYRDESAAILRDFEQFTRTARAFSLLGNHEHAHIGGPAVPKFYPDEAAVLDEALGEDRARMHDFMRSFPLLAVAPCGAVLTHGAPRSTERDLASFEELSYEGYQRVNINDMYCRDTVGALLWARGASEAEARALLEATSLDGRGGRPNAFVAYGHDVVREGFDLTGDSQICFSTSYGLFDERKVYLRLDLAARYSNVHDLRVGHEILPLYSA